MLDKEQMRLYLWEIEEQCRYALKAWKQIQFPETDTDNEPWCSIQSFLVAAANISKFLWPVSKAEERGTQLREFLSVQDDSPLKSRKVRDSFEHFDERLDSWLASGRGDNFGKVYGPGDLMKFEPEDNARVYNSLTGRLGLFGEEYDIQGAIMEIARIHSLLKDEPKELRRESASDDKPRE